MKIISTYKKRIIGLLLTLGLAVALCGIGRIGFIPSWVTYKEADFASKVQDYLVTDIDRDGDEEVIALLWKRGKYGQHKPFWVKENDTRYSQHLFIYDVEEDGKYRQKWCASDVGTPIRRMKMLDEEKGILLTETIDGVSNLWRWDQWGLDIMDNELSLVSFGDNIIHEEILEQADRYYGGNYDFIYEPFKKEIMDADIATVQLETILVDKKSAVAGFPSFGSPLEVGRALCDAGFDVMVCAGNHALDRGIYGIDVTTDFFEQEGVTCVGIQNGRDSEFRPYEVVEKKNMKIALFSYTYGTNGNDASDKYPYAVHYLPLNEEQERAMVEELKECRTTLGDKGLGDADDAGGADFVVAFVHWGDEYSKEVSETQKHLTQLFSEGGVDLVIGTHPHVVQESEVVDRPDGGRMLVFYSLGNFRAYQGWNEAVKTGQETIVTLEHTCDGVRIRDYSVKQVDAYVTRP